LNQIFKVHTPVQNMYTDANENVNIANIEKRMPLLYIVKIKHIIQHEHIREFRIFVGGGIKLHLQFLRSSEKIF